MFVNELIDYLKKPLFLEDRPTRLGTKIADIFYGYLIYVCLAILSVVLMMIVDKTIVKHFYNYSILEQFSANQKELKNKLGRDVIPIIVLIGPFVEEIMFRLPLKLKKVGLGICLAVITYRLIAPRFFHFDGWVSYLAISCSLGILLATILFFPSAVLTQVKEKYFSYLFYLSAVAFALIHISNFRPLHNELLFVYPIYTLPQFFMGLIVGYVRMKNGFVSGWALHALINLPFTLK